MYKFTQLFQFQECAKSILKHLGGEFDCNVCFIIEEKEMNGLLNTGSPHFVWHCVN